MDYIQFITLIATLGTVAFFGYKHSEKVRMEMNENRKETDRKLEAIQKEMKDFHGNLCKLEERFLNWLMKGSK